MIPSFPVTDLQFVVMLRECTYNVIVCQLFCLLLFDFVINKILGRYKFVHNPIQLALREIDRTGM